MTSLTAAQFAALAAAARGAVRVVAPGWPAGPGDVSFDVAQSLIGSDPPLLHPSAPRDADPATMALATITSAGRRAVAIPAHHAG